jgi:hypothetical protein
MIFATILGFVSSVMSMMLSAGCREARRAQHETQHRDTCNRDSGKALPDHPYLLGI